MSLYSAATNTLSKLLVRTNLPCRDVALSPDGCWVAVASDERVVRVVDVTDTTRTLALRDQADACRHVAFHPRGHLVAVSCADGVVYVYSLPAATHDQAKLVRRLEGIIQRHSGGAAQEGSAKACWSPDGRALALAAAVGREIVIVDCETWARQPRSFSGAHSAGQIADFAWSPNGAFLASAGSDGKIVVWDAEPPSGGQQQHMSAVATYGPHRNVCALAWHPSANTLSFTTSEGRLYTLANAVPAAGDLASRLKLPVRPAPLNGAAMDRLADAAAATSIRPAPDGILGLDESAGGKGRERGREGEEGGDEGGDDDDDNGDDDDDDDLDGWIVNDDGDDGGCLGRGAAKRKSAFADNNPAKRPFPGPATGGLAPPRLHAPFQPSATPWRANRRYLCLNMVGFVWTVDQDSHHTVTIEFHDREAFRDAHFTDALRHDKACLAEHGTLFACPPAGGDSSSSTEGEHPAMLYYRPHDALASRTTDWRMRLPAGETAVSIALSDSYAVACTSAGYVRVYTLSGMPVRVYRQKHGPVVTCASAGDRVLIVANGPLAADGRAAQLTYTLEDVRRDETLQSNDVVALPPAGAAGASQLQSVFFSDRGDPAVFDSAGVLLVLQHWRRPGQARWVPLLDTAALARLASGRKFEHYWPVALAHDKFHCIILKVLLLLLLL